MTGGLVVGYATTDDYLFVGDSDVLQLGNAFEVYKSVGMEKPGPQGKKQFGAAVVWDRFFGDQIHRCCQRHWTVEVESR